MVRTSSSLVDHVCCLQWWTIHEQEMGLILQLHHRMLGSRLLVPLRQHGGIGMGVTALMNLVWCHTRVALCHMGSEWCDHNNQRRLHLCQRHRTHLEKQKTWHRHVSKGMVLLIQDILQFLYVPIPKLFPFQMTRATTEVITFPLQILLQRCCIDSAS